MQTQLISASETLTASPTTSATKEARAIGGVDGVPKLLLRLEGALVLLAGLAAWSHEGGSWPWFVGLFLVPDLSMLGYLHNPRIGAALYNAGHSYVLPGVLATLAITLGMHALLLAAILWVAHIGFDRLMGYGLKYETQFVDTHLGQVGRQSARRVLERPRRALASAPSRGAPRAARPRSHSDPQG